jgi:methyltransferase
MDLSVVIYLILLAAVGAGRMVEMRISHRNQKNLAAQGVQRISEPHFRWMVVLHAGVLGGAALEVVFLRRPFFPALAAPMALLFIF